MIYDRHISKIRQYMRYGPAQYREDWEQSIALAMLMSDGTREHLQPVLNDCFDRMEAYQLNNPYVLPWEES